jgi:hypothetical protein
VYAPYGVFDQFPRYMKILLRDFNAKVGKPTIGNESPHKISNDKEVSVVNFVTSKNLVVKSMTFPDCDIYKYTLTSPEGKTHNQTEKLGRDWQ